MNRALSIALSLLCLSWAMMSKGAPLLDQSTSRPSSVLQPDCSERTACLCPWRGLLSLDDFAQIDPSRIPTGVLTYRHQDQCAWRVVQTTDGVKVFHTRPDYRRDNHVLPWKPATADKPWNKHGARLVVAVQDGYVIARNSGEWGAGAWWLSKDGRHSTQLGEPHITDLLGTRNGVVATGYHHTDNYSTVKGDVLLIARTANGKWRISKLAETNRPALSEALEDEGSVLVATADQVLRIALDGSVLMSHDGHWSEPMEVHEPIDYLVGFSPNSILPLPNGEILIGMNAVIVRLTPGPAGYSETWFGPKTDPSP